MIDKKIIALMTGKGNNTLKDKNLYPILGKPIMYYPCMEAKKSYYMTDFYVSSEDENILETAYDLGYKKIIRPDYLSQKNSQHSDVIQHAISNIKNKADILVVLLANAPMVKREWIDDCISIILSDESLSSVVPVYNEQNHHPYRCKRINRNGFLEPFVDLNNKFISTNRQELEACYFLCHNFWVLNMKNINFSAGQKPWIFLGNNIKPYIIEETKDLHDESDSIVLERWIKTNLYL